MVRSPANNNFVNHNNDLVKVVEINYLEFLNTTGKSFSSNSLISFSVLKVLQNPPCLNNFIFILGKTSYSKLPFSGKDFRSSSLFNKYHPQLTQLSRIGFSTKNAKLFFSLTNPNGSLGCATQIVFSLIFDNLEIFISVISSQFNTNM